MENGKRSNRNFGRIHRARRNQRTSDSYERTDDSYERLNDSYERTDDSYERLNDSYEWTDGSYERMDDCEGLRWVHRSFRPMKIV